MSTFKASSQPGGVPHLLVGWTRELLASEVPSPERRSALLRRAGLDEAVLAARDTRLEHDAACALWCAVTDAHPDPLFGIHFVARLPPAAFGFVSYLSMCSASGLEALQRFARYRNLVRADAFVEVIESSTTVRIVDMPAPGHAPWPRHLTEAIMAGFGVCFERWNGRVVRPIDVSLQHAAPDVAALVAAAFGARVRFAQPVNEIVFARADLAVPLRTADSALLEYLTPVADLASAQVEHGNPLQRTVEHAVRTQLASGNLSLARVAQRLGMGERTFQRRLRDQSLSFHAIVEEVRRAAALRLLDDSNLNRDEVALLLGYSEASSFRRALRRWTAPPARSDDAALG